MYEGVEMHGNVVYNIGNQGIILCMSVCVFWNLFVVFIIFKHFCNGYNQHILVCFHEKFYLCGNNAL